MDDRVQLAALLTVAGMCRRARLEVGAPGNIGDSPQRDNEVLVDEVMAVFVDTLDLVVKGIWQAVEDKLAGKDED